MKQLALQSTDERKERVIKRRGFERQKRIVLSELKASLEQKTQDQAQKLSQMRS
jgi:hypothetical protein